MNRLRDKQGRYVSEKKTAVDVDKIIDIWLEPEPQDFLKDVRLATEVSLYLALILLALTATVYLVGRI